MDPSEPLKQKIAIYIVQNEADVVVVELFKQGKYFLGDPVHQFTHKFHGCRMTE